MLLSDVSCILFIMFPRQKEDTAKPEEQFSIAGITTVFLRLKSVVTRMSSANFTEIQTTFIKFTIHILFDACGRLEIDTENMQLEGTKVVLNYVKSSSDIGRRTNLPPKRQQTL